MTTRAAKLVGMVRRRPWVEDRDRQAPAVGRGLSELLLHGRYQTLDLSRLGYRRILTEIPLRDEVPKP